MAKKRKTQSQVTQGGINITGNVEIKNSKVAARDIVEKNIVNIDVSFTSVYRALKESTTISPDAKKDLEADIRQIEKEIKKGDEAKPSFIKQRLENIQKMAPDIAEIVIATLQNPAAGVGLAVKKVINKFNAS